ncbi:hypothetical protein [Streptococcus sp.]|uniref:hypothetical protein n=1 Tax=Streptococcus sp. TaxID=1306 RepID=UPI00391D1BD2
MNLNQYAFETSAQPGLSVEKILQLEMIHCPKGEQTQIADFLDKKVAQLDKVKSFSGRANQDLGRLPPKPDLRNCHKRTG